MMHCHNLVHEDHDMMMQFAVGDLRSNDPITSDPPKPDTTPLGAFPAVYRPSFPRGPTWMGPPSAGLRRFFPKSRRFAED